MNADLNNSKLPEHLQKALLSIVEKCEQEDSFIRKQQLKMWKKNDEFWEGIQFIFWSETRQDWVTPEMWGRIQSEGGREGVDGPFYDYVINIFRAHGESVIAALSTQVPGVGFIPDDAEEDEDLSTARTYSKIADLIQRHNPGKLHFMQALFVAWNQGMIAMYHAPQTDESFGMNKIPTYGSGIGCKTCETSRGFNSEEEQTQFESGAFDPTICPECQNPMEATPIVASEEETPKTRVIWEVKGPVQVKVPYYAKSQKDFGYLLDSSDLSKDFIESKWPEASESLDSDQSSDLGTFEKIARAPSSFSSAGYVEDNEGLRTVKRCWIRPWKYNCLGRKSHEDEIKELEKRFPKGVYVAFCASTYLESRAENLDDFWTVTKVGLSRYIHSGALGQPLIPIQEMKNVLANLTLETVEHGITSTFADPRTLNFDVYSEHEARPGMIYPASPLPGKSLGESFYESGRATLSREVAEFDNKLESAGQFVTGSFPSIYGGDSEGSRTASEYTQSRQMALQRLSIAWTLVNFWWAQLVLKSVKLYIENMVSDERYVKRNGKNFVNIWIRRSELIGKVGDVEPESSDTFPLSSPQKQTLWMKLLEMQNEFVNAAAFSPANRQKLADIFGATDFEIPGQDQREKQSWEIQQMLQTQQPMPIEPEIDDHEAHIDMLRHYLVGDVGLDLRNSDPVAYQLLKMHLAEHVMTLSMSAMDQPEEEPTELEEEPVNA